MQNVPFEEKKSTRHFNVESRFVMKEKKRNGRKGVGPSGQDSIQLSFQFAKKKAYLKKKSNNNNKNQSFRKYNTRRGLKLGNICFMV